MTRTDLMVHSFLELDGVEISNGARTIQYLRNGLGSDGWQVGDGCACLALTVDVCPDAAGPEACFVSPAADPAPWYDAAVPESADFLGVLVKDVRPWFDGLANRNVTPRASGLGGASLGPGHDLPRPLLTPATLIANSCAGLEYGRRWLQGQLRRLCDPCALSVARIRSFCPDLTPGGPSTDPASVGPITASHFTGSGGFHPGDVFYAEILTPAYAFALGTIDTVDGAGAVLTYTLSDPGLAFSPGESVPETFNGGGGINPVILAADPGTSTFTFQASGIEVPILAMAAPPRRLHITLSTANDGVYTVVSATIVGTTLEVVVAEPIPSAIADGVTRFWGAGAFTIDSVNTIGGDPFAGEWFVYEVGLTDGMREVLQQDAFGQAAFGGGDDGACDFVEATFELLAGNPFLYKRAQPCTAGPVMLNPEACSVDCIDFCRWLTEPPPAVSCQVDPPRLGVLGTVITIDAGTGVHNLIIETLSDCADPASVTGALAIPYLPPGSVMVIDSALRRITFTPAGGDTVDGTPYISLPFGYGVPWLEVGDCNQAACVTAQLSRICDSDCTPTVDIQTRLREA